MRKKKTGLSLSLALAIASSIIAVFFLEHPKFSGRGWVRREMTSDGIMLPPRIDYALDFNSASPGKSGFREEPFSVEWTGYISVPIPDNYEFTVISDDGSQLLIDDHLVVDNKGIHPPRLAEGKVFLEPGEHRIQVRYFNESFQAFLQVFTRLDGRLRLLDHHRVRTERRPNAFSRFLSDFLFAAEYYFYLVLPFLMLLPTVLLFIIFSATHLRLKSALPVIAFFCLFFVFISSPRIVSDGYGYFSYLRSIIFDRNMEFSNEFSHEGEGFNYNLSQLLQQKTETGRTPNYWSVGPALLWAPFYLASLIISGINHLSSPGFRFSGYTVFEVTAVGFASSFWGLAAVLLAYFFTKRFFDNRTTLFASLVCWTGTTLFYFTFFETSFAHAPAAFAVSLYFFTWYKFRRTSDLRHWFIIGFTGGLMVLVYWQNALFLSAAGLDLIYLAFVNRKNSLPFRTVLWNFFTRLTAFSAAVFLAASPQLLVWKILFNRFLFIPQGKNFVWNVPNNLIRLLAAPHHGLFTWTPITFLALTGWFSLRKKLGSAWYFMSTGLFLFYLHNAMVSDWYGGGAFGMRRFTNIFIFFVPGMAAFYERYGKRLACKILIPASVIYAWIVMACYRLNIIGITSNYRELLSSLSQISPQKFTEAFFPSTYYKYFMMLLNHNEKQALALFMGFYLLMFTLAAIILKLLSRHFFTAEMD